MAAAATASARAGGHTQRSVNRGSTRAARKPASLSGDFHAPAHGKALIIERDSPGIELCSPISREQDGQQQGMLPKAVKGRCPDNTERGKAHSAGNWVFRFGPAVKENFR